MSPEASMTEDCWESCAVVEFDSKSWAWQEKEFRVTLQPHDGLDLDGMRTRSTTCV